jgi:hypothetical protein
MIAINRLNKISAIDFQVADWCRHIQLNDTHHIDTRRNHTKYDSQQSIMLNVVMLSVIFARCRCALSFLLSNSYVSLRYVLLCQLCDYAERYCAKF